MCLGTPMRIIQVDGLNARCVPVMATRAPDQAASERVEPPEVLTSEVITLALTGPLDPGHHVLTHLGSAIRVLDTDEAEAIADALAAVEAAASGQPFDHLLTDLIERTPELPDHLQPDQATDRKSKGGTL